MELKYKIGLSIWFLILFSLFSLAATQKIFVETNYRGNNVLNISNLTGVDFLNITLGYIGVSQIATLSDLTAGNITVTSIIEVRNDEPVTLSAGDPVYFDSYISGLSLQGVKFANNTDTSKHSDCVILDTISTNTRGQCVIEGHVTGMDTSDFSFGDELYLDHGGNLTPAKPTEANCIQKIAMVLRSHVSLGVVWVSGAGRCNDVSSDFTITGNITLNTLFGQWDGSAALIDNYNLNSNTGWTNLTKYPSACTAGSYITTLGDSITCVTPECSDVTNCVVGAITSIVLDTSPELGGYLDANGKDIGSKTDEIENIYMGLMNNISFGDGQEAQIWYNGSSLVIKVT